MTTTAKTFVAGATGFVGRAILDGWTEHATWVAGVRRLSSLPRGVEQRPFDLNKPSTIANALAGCQQALYLVHGMADHDDYADWEVRTATQFAQVAHSVGVKRIVYLGGVVPRYHPSAHLQARARTGAALRSHHPQVIELRAGMVVGAGSTSHRCVRDVVTRLPWLPLPMWAQCRQSPVALVDVLAAVQRSLHPDVTAGIYDLPGPQSWRHIDVLQCAADSLGVRPRIELTRLPIPVSVIGMIASVLSDAPPVVVRQLLAGLPTDLIGSEVDFFARWLPQHRRQPLAESFQEAAQSLGAEQRWSSWLAETGVAALTTQLRRWS
jgi:uncharacterized protein YbjT (DUF2867 family)